MPGTTNTSGGVNTPIQQTWVKNPLIHCRRAAIGFAQGLFGQVPVGDFKWTQDIKTTDIVITDANPINLEYVMQRPAINCVRAPVKFNRTSMDDFQHRNYRTGQRIHGDMISGNIVFNCCSENGYEAEDIAWFLTDHLWILRRNLLKAGFHDIGRGIELSAVTPAGAVISGDSDQTWRKVSVIVPFTFNWRKIIRPTNTSIAEFVDLRINAYTGVYRTTMAGAGMVGTAISQDIDGETEIPRRDVQPYPEDDDSLDMVVRVTAEE